MEESWDRGRYQIDYILIKNRFRNSVKCAKTYPGADIFSDHNLVAAKIEEVAQDLSETKLEFGQVKE